MTNHAPLILVVDDDVVVRKTLSLNLQADGFDVVTAASGSEAIHALGRRLPDLAIVDLLLPDMHGFDVCRRIKAYLDLPIVMLTAVGTEESVIQGLEDFAEDYIIKPYSYKQLLARITRVLKRSRSAIPESDVMRLGDAITVDFARHTILAYGRSEILTPTESRALACLARRVNQLVANETLIDEIWPEAEGDTNRLWVLISRLRHKIEPDPREPIHLINERSIGYRLIG